MLKGLEEINDDLEKAQDHAAKLRYPQAVDALDAAIEIAGKIRDERNQALQAVTATWDKTWFPRVRQANGRQVAPTHSHLSIRQQAKMLVDVRKACSI